MGSGQLEVELLWSTLSSVAVGTEERDRALNAVRQSSLIAECAGQHAGTAANFFAALRSRVASLLQLDPSGATASEAAISVFKTGIACLEGFMQCNLCGPISSNHTLLWEAQSAQEPTATSSHSSQPGTWGRDAAAEGASMGQGSLSADEQWVVSQLEVDGEDVVGRVEALDLLLAALICLAEPLGHVTTTDTQQQHQQPQQQVQQQQQGKAHSSESADTDSSSGPHPGQSQQQDDELAPLLTPARLLDAQLGSWCWWCLRAVLLQQHVLTGRSITLQTSLKKLTKQTLAWAAALQEHCQQQLHSSSNTSNVDEQQAAAVKAQGLAAVAHLEVAVVQQTLGAVLDAEQQLEAAAAALGVTVELTGALGVRTKHQIDPKAQLIAAVKAAAAGSNGSSGGSSGTAAVGLEGVDVGLLGFEEVGLTKELEGMTDDSAVYLAPRLTTQTQDAAAAGAASSSSADGGSSGSSGGDLSAGQMDSCQQQIEQQQQQSPLHQQQRLSTLLQALLLGWAAQIKKGTSQDELQQWQMAPFVEAVLQQQYSHYMLHATARLLKCRHEKARGRTRERALMQLEQLCNALQSPQPGVVLRLPFVFAVRFPLWPLLRKEMAEFYIAMGFVGAALKVFESLEMWDQLILCYRLLDKKQLAQELVLNRLKLCPCDAKLWCVLGDISGDEGHYLKAWEVSRHRSSRAQRSIGRSAVRKKEWVRAAAAYESALALSPLYPDAWFSLGYAYIKMNNTHKALQSFSQVTHLDPDHGEAWTNLAALWLQEGGWREALHASQQAVKAKRDSWQTWDNYALAAAKAQQPAACTRALGEVFELTRGQHFPLQTAEILMDLVEHEHSAINSNAAAAAPAAAAAATNSEDEDDDEVMEAPEQLLQMLAVTSQMRIDTASNATAADGSGEDAAAASDTAVAAAAASRQRQFDGVLHQLGVLLKQVVNSPACCAGVWGLMGRWYALQGEMNSSQEAWLKQVRALQSSPYKTDSGAFAAMADASIKLGQAYLHLAGAAQQQQQHSGSSTTTSSSSSSQFGLRELSAARMHLRGVLKQCEAAFEGAEKFRQMQELLQQVVAAEDAALAAKKAAEAVAAGGQ